MRFVSVVLGLVVAPAFALAQPGGGMGSTPMATDLKKVPVGTWAEYTLVMGQMTAKTRWALVARDARSTTIEMGMEGGPMAMMGGKTTMQMVLAPDPAKAEKPVLKMVMQMGANDPMEMPLDMGQGPTQKFEKPDPKKLVGKEEIKTAAGTFKASHYRDTNDHGTMDYWVDEKVGPLGMIKMTMVPKPGAGAPRPGGPPPFPVTMELAARGKDAKPSITKPAKPFDPSLLMGGGRGAGGPPPPGAGGPPPPGAGGPPPSGKPEKK